MDEMNEISAAIEQGGSSLSSSLISAEEEEALHAELEELMAAASLAAPSSGAEAVLSAPSAPTGTTTMNKSVVTSKQVVPSNESAEAKLTEDEKDQKRLERTALAL